MVLRVFRWPVTRFLSGRTSTVVISRRSQTTNSLKPLRILFCGSDKFSCASLQAVHQEQLRNPGSISSIDVLLRPGKPSGRGLKAIREVPIKHVAQELGLSIHERDTFTGWTLPRPNGDSINLIIAVSFGLFVPPRILKSAEYGGINIHPSLLPDFRGPAPLHHTLLAGETHTGVTLQTLHPEKFDHGSILAQTPHPGLEIPNTTQCTYSELLEFITPKAAEMLVQGIRDRVFLSQANGTTSNRIASSDEETRLLRHAPKITNEERHIDWVKMSSEEILRRDRVLGRLWSNLQVEEDSTKRIIFGALASLSTSKYFRRENNSTESHFISLLSHAGERIHTPCIIVGETVLMPTIGGDYLVISEVTVEGSKKTTAAKALFPGV